MCEREEVCGRERKCVCERERERERERVRVHWRHSEEERSEQCWNAL